MVMRREIRPAAVPLRGVDDPAIKREFDAVATAVDQHSSSDIAGARLISGLQATVGVPLRVNHGLGRKPKTWWVCAPRGAWMISQNGEPTDRILVLNSATTLKFDLMVM